MTNHGEKLMPNHPWRNTTVVENGVGEIPVDFLMDTFTFTQDYPQGGAPVR